MKRFFSAYFLTALGSMLVFASCMKNDNNTPQVPVAGIMAFNLAPDKAVTFALNGNAITNAPLQFNNYTGSYLGAYVGNRTISAYDGYSNMLLASKEATFEEDKYYSAFAVGYDGSYRNVVVPDNYDTLSGSNGKAYVRFINGVADSVTASAVKVTNGGTEVVDTTVSLGGISDFVAVEPGDVTVSINGGTDINASRTFAVEQRKVYTILLIGAPGVSDEAKKVQVRYVEMGTLSEEDAGGDSVSVTRSASIK